MSFYLYALISSTESSFNYERRGSQVCWVRFSDRMGFNLGFILHEMEEERKDLWGPKKVFIYNDRYSF